MRGSIRLLFALLLAVTASGRGLFTQGGITVPADVAARVAADGSALVIVGVRAPFVPEGLLAGPAAVDAQREALHAAVDAAMGRAAAAGMLVGDRFETIPFFTGRVDQGALAALTAMPDVSSVQEDRAYPPILSESVPLVNAPVAWSFGHTGMGWNVAIIDTGVESSHGFLTSKVVAEACYSNANGGATSIGGSSLCPGGAVSSTAAGSGAACSATLDGCDHGTHVAGIAAGFGGPGGMSGVAPGASLYAMQVFTRIDNSSPDWCGASSPCILTFTSDYIRALERVLTLAGPGNVNMVASANMSLGGGGPFTNCNAQESATKTAIDNLRSIGVATVIASGNNGFVSGVSSPACITTSVSVGSSTKLDVVSNFTNAGGGLPYLLAPGGGSGQAGTNITSSVLNNLFGAKAGTSMAAPHVAGAWAILKQAVPTATVTDVLNALRTTGLLIPDPPSGGSYPRINVNAARLALLAPPNTAPGAPGTPVITGAGNSITISWAAPSTGGAPTSYTVLARATPGGAIIATLPVGNVLGTSVTAPNGTFHVTVRAANASGTGPESAGTTFSVPIVPAPPGPPTGLDVAVAGNEATFTWTPPASGGSATGYVLRAALSPGGPAIAALPFSAPATGLIVRNIPPGTYHVHLVATNAGGSSAASNEVSLTVAGPQPPGAPTMNTPTVVGNQVTLSWSAPTTGGAPTSYRIVASLTSGGPAIATLNVTGIGTTVPAPNGTFFIRVHGVNAVGVGPASNEVTATVP